MKNRVPSKRNVILNRRERKVAKHGAIAENYDDEYKRISEEINDLKKTKLRLVQEKKEAENYGEQQNEMESALRSIKADVREFDEDLVRRLIQTIKVNKDKSEKLEIQFESGVVMDQMVDYYD